MKEENLKPKPSGLILQFALLEETFLKAKARLGTITSKPHKAVVEYSGIGGVAVGVGVGVGVEVGISLIVGGFGS